MEHYVFEIEFSDDTREWWLYPADIDANIVSAEVLGVARNRSNIKGAPAVRSVVGRSTGKVYTKTGVS